MTLGKPKRGMSVSHDRDEVPFRAGKVADMQVCPMLTGPVPHVGGVIAEDSHR
jgi:hypothetical protein